MAFGTKQGRLKDGTQVTLRPMTASDAEALFRFFQDLPDDIDPERVFVNVHRYANMSAATVPVALVEALEEGRVRPGAHLLLPSFGAGLSLCAHLVRWGERTAPLGRSDAELPPCDRTGLELVRELRARKAAHREHARAFVEAAGPAFGAPQG